MRRSWTEALLLVWTLGPGVAPAGEASGSEGFTFAGSLVPFLDRYCVGCHDDETAKGNLVFGDYPDVESLRGDPGVWDIVARRVRLREMPPKDSPQPPAEEIDAVVRWIGAELARVPEGQDRDPGRVTIRRLNRVEYSNTVRDLLGVSFDATEAFPSDDVGYGFDNIGDVLSLPPLLFEKYLSAAETIAAEALMEGSPSRDRLIVCDPQQGERCRRRIVRRLATRAFRRPAAPEEVQGLLGVVAVAEDAGGSFEDGLRLAVESVLVSPHFLFRVEIDRAPDDPGAIHPLSGFELASRLSYFLWSTMPDDELFRLARGGELLKDDVLGAQARRMLADSRSRALVDRFAPQWLQIGRLRDVEPDRDLFPSFSEDLRAAMLEETKLFFEFVMREDRSILDFLQADYTFVNRPLARHYGLENPGLEGRKELEGADEHTFRRVGLDGSVRGGVLTMASVLTATSNPTRTSPVKRGKWVLEILLGAPPPPPPPNVPELDEKPEAALSGTLRQRMEQHRADPACATCHVTMDALGFGLENFDAVGAWRAQDAGMAIDASGELPGNRSFDGPAELRRVLLEDHADFRRAFTRAMLTYALGRGLEPYDRPTVDEIVSRLQQEGDKFSSLVLGVVESDAFRLRRGDKGTP